jgi:hypothetical protein
MVQGTWLPLPTALSRVSKSGYIRPMSTTSKDTANKVHCSQCDQPERQCDCEKFCCLCQSMLDIKLCHDGLYYCQPCREACDYKEANPQAKGFSA